MRVGKEAGLARILIAERTSDFDRRPPNRARKRAGMAALFEPRRVITCAHVVNTALGEPENGTRRPTRPVEIVFPLADNSNAVFLATVMEDGWFPIGHPKTPDVAVLQLQEAAPKEVGLTVFALVRTRLDADELSVYGGDDQHAVETHVAAAFVGRTMTSQFQLAAVVDKNDPARGQTAGPAPNVITKGFSGAAVWDKFHDVAIGLMCREDNFARDTAYMIPSATLLQAWPSLPTEYRRLPRTFEIVWNAIAAALWLAMIYFMIGNRKAVEGHEDLISPFFGLHFYAFLAPVLGCLWFLHARDFRLHDWSSRVPRFLAIPFERGTEPAKISALLTLSIFVFSLFWIEGHFTRVFYNRGNVYIYPDQFGFKPEELTGCIPRDTPLCPHPQAGRFERVEPRPPATGGYWDNAYHYGGNTNGSTVTFFPILQPLILQGFALAAVLIQSAALVRTFGRGDWLIIPFGRLAFWRRPPATSRPSP